MSIAWSLKDMTIVIVYLDDVILTGNDADYVADLKSNLHSRFGIKDFGLLNYFLGIEINHTPGGIIFFQRKFAKSYSKILVLILLKKHLHHQLFI